MCVYNVATQAIVHMLCCCSCFYSEHLRDLGRNLDVWLHKSKLSHTLPAVSSTHLILFWMKNTNHFLALIKTIQYLPANRGPCDKPGILFQPRGMGKERNWWPRGFTPSRSCFSFFLCSVGLKAPSKGKVRGPQSYEVYTRAHTQVNASSFTTPTWLSLLLFLLWKLWSSGVPFYISHGNVHLWKKRGQVTRVHNSARSNFRQRTTSSEILQRCGSSFLPCLQPDAVCHCGFSTHPQTHHRSTSPFISLSLLPPPRADPVCLHAHSFQRRWRSDLLWGIN